MLPIRTILVATDFSPMAASMLPLRRGAARDYGARLIAVHVVSPPVAVYAETAVFMDEPDLASACDAIRELRVTGVPIEHRVLEGDPPPPSSRSLARRAPT